MTDEIWNKIDGWKFRRNEENKHVDIKFITDIVLLFYWIVSDVGVQIIYMLIYHSTTLASSLPQVYMIPHQLVKCNMLSHLK